MVPATERGARSLNLRGLLEPDAVELGLLPRRLDGFPGALTQCGGEWNTAVDREDAIARGQHAFPLTGSCCRLGVTDERLDLERVGVALREHRATIGEYLFRSQASGCGVDDLLEQADGSRIVTVCARLLGIGDHRGKSGQLVFEVP